MSRAYDSTGRSRQAWIAFAGAGSFVARRVLCLAVALSLAGCDLHGSDNHAHAVKGKTVPQNLRIRSLADAPTAENYVAPGIKGLDAQLRARATRTRSGACPSTVKFHTPKAKLARYTPYKSPTTPPDPGAFNIRQIVIKFVEGSGVRLRGHYLLQEKGDGATDARARLARSGIENPEVLRELRLFKKAVASMRAVIGRATPFVSEQELVRLRRCAESHSRQELPDLNLFYFVHLPNIDSESAQRFLKRLQAFRIVESAYFQPIPFDAADIPPLTTIDVTPSQGYLQAAPKGIDVDWARHFSSGRGNTMRIVDIESAWNLTHEDLPAPSFGFGTNWGSLAAGAAGAHGTAVFGELVAEENGFGATGIAPQASIGWSATTNLDPTGGIYLYSVGSALLSAQRFARAGDIALIEQQFSQYPFEGEIGTPRGARVPPPPCPAGLPLWVAVEEYPLEHAAIANITRAGIIVVEAAGNGATQVEPASMTDSGAIVVGASDTALGPMCFSNFGPRVDVQGWGMSVATTGYGGGLAPDGSLAVDPTLRANGADATQFYTKTFGGTSSASPIVAGAAALIQSTRNEFGLPLLNSFDMRSLLASTGTPQLAGSTPNIGPLPNLRKAIASYLPDAARFVSQTNAPTLVIPGQKFTIQAVTFANVGGRSWTGDHTMAAAPSFQTGQQQFQGPPIPLGAPPDAEVFPEDEVTKKFDITAPTQPGTYRLAFLLRTAAGQQLASSPAQQVVVAMPNTPIDNARIVITSAPNSLPAGGSAPVTIFVMNTGTSTWTQTAYSIGLQRGMRISIPQQALTLPGSFGPGAAISIPFTISCNGNGQGWFTAQMQKPTGGFGQAASQTVVCH